MSDKSFGDYTNRNVVKNPLLSTAVTGMSIEDLTHNAVLLPAVPNQGLISSQDTKTLNTPLKEDTKLNKNVERKTPLQTKPKDDFDVNEYFARLQGTRYVSAPFDCDREDQNANLDAEEENLEEINLNESRNEVEYSITSDIAQNFSQLPQVLPQVASAVFSSFSNMLSLKSREQTPDDVKKAPVSDVPFDAPASAVSGGVEASCAAPPLKEPPRFASSSNTYRIAAKKKTYAPIPGLSSGDAVPTIQPALGIAPNTGLQSFFDPTAQTKLNPSVETLENVPKIESPKFYVPTAQGYLDRPIAIEASTQNLQFTNTGLSSSFYNSTSIEQQSKPIAMSDNIPKDRLVGVNTQNLEVNVGQPDQQSFYDSNRPVTELQNIPKDSLIDVPTNLQTAVTGPQSFYDPIAERETVTKVDQPIHNIKILEEKTNVTVQNQHTEPEAGIIPPPPMFSSIPQRTEGPNVISRAIVPPSVARRISNQPSKSIQPVETNFFIPQMSDSSDIDSFNNNKANAENTQEANMTTQIDQSAVSSFNASTYGPIETSTSTCQSTLPQEPPKPIPEPPKIAAGHSYRLKNKRPQYYSGPIEGIGSVSDNLKRPIPTFDQPTTSYHGSMLTPVQTAVESTTPLFTPSEEPIAETTYVFNSPPLADVNIGQLPLSTNKVPSVDPYATAFDLSRPYENETEIPKQDSRFGLLGSLKSKLNSIDINRIQNSVTTFFDPNYNVVPKTNVTQDNDKYPQSSNFEVFVPNVDHMLNQPAFELSQPSQYPTSFYDQYNSPQSAGQYLTYGQPVVEANTAETTFTHQLGYNSLSHRTDFQKVNENTAHINLFTPTNNLAHDSMNSTVTESQDVNEDSISNVNFFSARTLQPSESLKKEDTLDNIFMASQKQKTVVNEGIMPSSENFFNIQAANENTTQIPNKMDMSKCQNTANVNFFSAPTLQPSESLKKENESIDNIFMASQEQPDVVNTGMPSPTNFFNIQAANEDKSGIPAEADIDKKQDTSNVNFFTVPTFQSTEKVSSNTTVENDNKAPVDLFMTPKEQSTENRSDVISENLMIPASNFFDKPDLHDKNENLQIPPNTTQSNSFSIPTLQPEQPPISQVNYFATPSLQQETVPPVLSSSEKIASAENARNFFDLSKLAYEIDSESAEAPVPTQRSFFDLQRNLVSPVTQTEDNDCKTKFFNLPNTQKNEDIKTDNIQANMFTIPPLTAKEELPTSVIGLKDETDVIEYQTKPEVQFQNTSVCDKLNQAQSEENSRNFFDFPPDITSVREETIAPFDIVPPTDTTIDKKSRELLEEREEAGTDYCCKNTVYPDDISGTTYSLESLPLAVNLPQSTQFIEDAKHDREDAELATKLAKQMQVKTTSISEAERKAIAEKVEYNLATAEKVNEMFSNDSPTPAIPPGFEMRAIELGIYPAHALKKAEVKAEFIAGQKYAVTVPTAPEHDDITDSNTGQLDVNLIEQDAKNYFPVDDDAIENSENDEKVDSFTDRVDKYNKQERCMTLENSEEQVALYQCFPSTAVTFASYFDTGNYAVDTHYRKSLTSPSSVTSQLNSPSSVFSPETLEVKSLEDDVSDTKFNVDETPIVTEVIEADQSKEEIDPKLTDPLNFFSDDSVKKEEPNEGFNRLASYFTAQPQKKQSFFELSQGQKHLRKNIDEKYRANLELMKDLTSIENYTPNKDDVVKTVNYFEVEYFNKLLLKNMTKDKETQVSGKSDLEKHVNNNNENVVSKNKKEMNTNAQNETEYETEETKNVNAEFKNCKICCDTDKNNLLNFTNFKIRKNMDSDGNGVKEKCHIKSNEVNRNLGVGRDPVKVNFEEGSKEMENWPNHENRTSSDYQPVKYHWFYRVDRDTKSVWKGFSDADSSALEDAFNCPDLNDSTVVATDGGRYDVNLSGRLRVAVYWSEKPTNVRRCSWFYKGNTDIRYVPYTEAVANILEDEYRNGVLTGVWHRRLCLPNNDVVVMHGPNVMEHFLNSTNDAWASGTQSTTRQIRRGHDESEIEDHEPSNIDHLLLLCHGVGSACDLKLRPIEEVVEDFRSSSLHLIQGHYKNSYDNGVIGRIEMLPISWHSTLHSGPNGVDRRLSQITLESIPKLRNFTNDTVLDVLFYTSPIFCQIIIDTVCSELNRIFDLFKKRNPNFNGGVSLGGHSLGSVILYDLLCHQGTAEIFAQKKLTAQSGSGNDVLKYPKINFNVDALYALGSPIAIFECIRGVELLGEDFKLPTCKAFYNIFHPYDPIAYRIEPLINPELKNIPPYLIPHHKGRKRMHLELKETMARVGADIKQKFVDYMKSTLSIMWNPPAPTPEQLEKVVEEQIEKEDLIECKDETSQNLDDSKAKLLGKLNGGRRVDYVLQEAPLEIINEYIFAMTSHVRYWESEDTVLMMLREIYSSMNVLPDCTVPQQTLTVERTRVYTNTDEETTITQVSGIASTSRELP